MSFAASSATGVVPIFPLDKVCLLPGEILALHVFEPRYRQMVHDVVEGERLIAIGSFQPGWETSYFGNPPIFPCLGVGSMVVCQPRDDGRFDIVLQGIARVRLVETLKEMPYRLGRCVDLPEVVSDPNALTRILDGLCDTITDYARVMKIDPAAVEALLADRAVLPGRVASLVSIPSKTKQEILEADDQVERFGSLSRAFREAVNEARKQADRSRGAGSSDQSWN